MLAHMIGDGSCVKRQPVRYAPVDEANLAAVTIAAAHFGVTPIRDEYAAARVTTLRLPAPYRLARGKRNPIAEWLDRLGRLWSEKDFAFATGTRFDGSRTWTHAPGRSRLHRIAEVFADPELHGLATNDIYWDKIISIGHQSTCEMTLHDANPLVVQGVLVRCAGT